MYIKYKYIILTSCTSRPSWVPQVGEGVLVQAPMPGQGCASALQDDLRSSFKALCAHIHHVLHAPSRAKVGAASRPSAHTYTTCSTRPAGPR